MRLNVPLGGILSFQGGESSCRSEKGKKSLPTFFEGKKPPLRYDIVGEKGKACSDLSSRRKGE